MKIVTRSGVFETNSSSVHSYTCPIKSERISFKGWARSKADKDKVVNIDFDWWIDETGVVCKLCWMHVKRRHQWCR